MNPIHNLTPYSFISQRSSNTEVTYIWKGCNDQIKSKYISETQLHRAPYISLLHGTDIRWEFPGLLENQFSARRRTLNVPCRYHNKKKKKKPCLETQPQTGQFNFQFHTLFLQDPFSCRLRSGWKVIEISLLTSLCLPVRHSECVRNP
jgi:hypothetical protein